MTEPVNTGMLWLKCLSGGRATYTGAIWPMPKGEPDADGWTVGPWTPREKPVLCRSGWHVLSDTAQLLDWGLHQDVWLCEVRGAHVLGDDKATWEQARLVWRCPWDDTARRLFAADCAERVLPIFEGRCPGDDRPRKAIEAARAFVRGEIGRDQMRDAASAAYAAYAAYAAAYAAYAADAAYAASDAASDAYAASASASYAASAAGWTSERRIGTERRWQAERLAHYLGLEP